MLSDKGTNIFSEIGKFFQENDATSAMNAIMDTTKALRLSEKRLFGSGRESVLYADLSRGNRLRKELRQRVTAEKPENAP